MLPSTVENISGQVILKERKKINVLDGWADKGDAVMVLTLPRVNGWLFCVHLISVSGWEPSTMQTNVYSVCDENCLGFSNTRVDEGFTN